MIDRVLQAAAVGLLAVASVTGGDAVTNSTHIEIGSALAVAGVVIPAVWWLSSWMRGITDKIESNGSQMRLFSARLEDVAEGGRERSLRLTELSNRIDALPCCGVVTPPHPPREPHKCPTDHL